MTLPNFLVVGVEKCGTTWLRELLTSHSDIFLPSLATEVHFFDRYYDRGTLWYERFFPSEAEASRFKAIGEITPSYFHCADCPERIAAIPSIDRLLLMVRNPVDRAYSHYWHRIRIDRFTGSFQDFLTSQPNSIHWGYYSKSLNNYLCYFSRDQILVLIFEEAVSDIRRTKNVLARFLSIPADRFPQSAGTTKVNKGRLPRFPAVYTRAVYGARRLRDLNLDWPVSLAKRIGIPRLFDSNAFSVPPMDEEDRKQLMGIYEDEIRELECLLQVSLACWRK
jgi:hypothetical protein